MKYLGPISNAKDLVNKEYVDNTAFSELLPLFIDVLYPVGCYFSTSDEDFNPNNSWGGTWTLLGEGKVLISGSSNGNYRVGNDYGENTKNYTPAGSVGNHSLKISELESHIGHLGKNSGVVYDGNFKGFIDASTGHVYGSTGRGWNNNSSELYPNGHSLGGGGAHSHGFTGTAATINVMQKSLATYIWHRTA